MLATLNKTPALPSIKNSANPYTSKQKLLLSVTCIFIKQLQTS